jgi:hypothetical protein
MAALALGLGAAPLLASLLPMAPWTAAAVALGALLGAGPVLSGEARVARLDVEQGRPPLSAARWHMALLPAVASTLTASVAALQAAWGAAALARLALDGPTAVSAEGVTSWLGAQQGFLGHPGLQGSVALLIALAAVLGLLVLLARHGGQRLLVGAVALALALLLACGVRLWLSGPSGVAWLDLNAAWPDAWADRLGELGTGLAAGLFAAGAATGAAHALLHRARSTTRPGRSARLAPLAVTAVGVLVLWPLLSALVDATRFAPAPYGREAAVLLVAPGAALGSVAWQALWFAGVLLAGLAGAAALAQPALRGLGSLLGLSGAQAMAALLVLLAITALPCVLLPGALEGLRAGATALLLILAGLWQCADLRVGWTWARGVVGWLGFLVCAGLAPFVAFGWVQVFDGRAVREGFLLAVGLALVLALLWWPALLLLAALRSRALSRSAPASPADPRTRA